VLRALIVCLNTAYIGGASKASSNDQGNILSKENAYPAQITFKTWFYGWHQSKWQVTF